MRPNLRLAIAFVAGVVVTLLVWLVVSVLPQRAEQPTPATTTVLLAPTTSPAQGAVTTTTVPAQPVPTGKDPAPSPPPAPPAPSR